MRNIFALSLTLLFAISCAKQAIKSDINSSDPDERVAGTLEICKKGDPRDTGKLIMLLRDSDPLVRSTAVEALATFKKPELAEEIIPLLQDASAMVRQSSAMTLGELKNEICIAYLAEVVRTDPDEWVKVKAIQALSKFPGNKDALFAISTALEDKSVAVSHNAYKVLVEITGKKDLPPERKAWEEYFKNNP